MEYRESTLAIQVLSMDQEYTKYYQYNQCDVIIILIKGGVWLAGVSCLQLSAQFCDIFLFVQVSIDHLISPHSQSTQVRCQIWTGR